MTPVILLLLIICAFAWSGLDFSRKLLADRIASTTALALMCSLVCVACLVWALFEAPPGRWVTDRSWTAPAMGSLALNVVANVLYFRSIQLSPFSQTIPLLSLTPLFTSLIAWAYLGERLTPRQGAGMVLVVVAAFLLQSGPRRPAAVVRAFFAERGAPLMVAVAVCWSGTPSLDKQAILHGSAAFYAAFLNGGVAIAALAFLAAQGKLGDLRRSVGRTGWALFLTLVFGTVGLLTQLIVIREIPVGLVETAKRGLGGFLAVAIGAWFFGERVTAWKVGTVAVMTLGVALILL